MSQARNRLGNKVTLIGVEITNKYVYSLSLFITADGLTLTNKGTQFFLTFTDIAGTTANPQIFFFTNVTQSVLVSISAPRYLRYPNPQLYSISSTNPYTWAFPDRRIRLSGTESSTKGICINATSPVSIYTLDHEYESTGGYLALPYQSLGTDYIATTYFENIPGAVGSQIGNFIYIFFFSLYCQNS
jgi:hypothetical protein